MNACFKSTRTCQDTCDPASSVHYIAPNLNTLVLRLFHHEFWKLCVLCMAVMGWGRAEHGWRRLYGLPPYSLAMGKCLIIKDTACIKYRKQDVCASIIDQHWSPAHMHIYRYTDAQIHRYTDTLIHRYTDTQTHRRPDTQVHRYTDTQIHRCVKHYSIKSLKP